ncbi:hypothetical protein QBC38DRAFT_453470 [Podospora fimiseda]|uniref:Uncharacterized protein n=1 Tax=Podospora fimiseda TaxID=252190 RepID=A0AAN7BTL8_9PEZI|nr:hypothetical protein QBC38DRAFT_453470 [Podospora fimiseda]
MTSPNPSRPGSSAAGLYPSSIPPSPRPSITVRGSRSSLRREIDLHDPALDPRPASVAAAHPSSSPSPPIAVQTHTEPPTFSPLFALLTSTSHSTNQQTIHHPTVRYIFEDDDPEELTAELARHHRNQGPEGEDSGEFVDRAVILDMDRTADGTGFKVAWASSLSPDWAVTSANVSTMEGGVDGTGAAFVLKIEGVSLDSSSFGAGGAPTGEGGHSGDSSATSAERQQPRRPESNREEYGDLLQEFDKRMAVLRRVTEAGAERQRLLREQEAAAAEASAAHYFHGIPAPAPQDEKQSP